MFEYMHHKDGCKKTHQIRKKGCVEVCSGVSVEAEKLIQALSLGKFSSLGSDIHTGKIVDIVLTCGQIAEAELQKFQE